MTSIEYSSWPMALELHQLAYGDSFNTTVFYTSPAHASEVYMIRVELIRYLNRLVSYSREMAADRTVKLGIQLRFTPLLISSVRLVFTWYSYPVYYALN